mmetsp:Transcript_6933/g.12763  ORF Transcript_6933/g.12763 Transcript_6933/m.12763 type:complete len:277 (+) Transcript_6933:313-1143(+)
MSEVNTLFRLAILRIDLVCTQPKTKCVWSSAMNALHTTATSSGDHWKRSSASSWRCIESRRRMYGLFCSAMKTEVNILQPRLGSDRLDRLTITCDTKEHALKVLSFSMCFSSTRMIALSGSLAAHFVAMLSASSMLPSSRYTFTMSSTLLGPMPKPLSFISLRMGSMSPVVLKSKRSKALYVFSLLARPCSSNTPTTLCMCSRVPTRETATDLHTSLQRLWFGSPGIFESRPWRKRSHCMWNTSSFASGVSEGVCVRSRKSSALRVTKVAWSFWSP